MRNDGRSLARRWRTRHYGQDDPRTIEDLLMYLMALGAMPTRPLPWPSTPPGACPGKHNKVR